MGYCAVKAAKYALKYLSLDSGPFSSYSVTPHPDQNSSSEF